MKNNTHTHTHTHTHTYTHEHTHTHTHRERERERERETERQRERERETDRQTDRQREREREVVSLSFANRFVRNSRKPSDFTDHPPKNDTFFRRRNGNFFGSLNTFLSPAVWTLLSGNIPSFRFFWP